MSLVEREKRVGLHLPVEVRGRGRRRVPLHRAHPQRERERWRDLLREPPPRRRSGDRLELSIELPVSLRRHFGDRDIYRARAVVCRVERFAGESPARVGARFLGRPPSREWYNPSVYPPHG